MPKRPCELMVVARERSGVTQEEIAARCGVSQPAVARWEKGDATPQDLYAAAKAYGLDPNKLIAAFVAERKRKAA